jgi:hypothetical protein
MSLAQEAGHWTDVYFTPLGIVVTGVVLIVGLLLAIGDGR